MASNRFSKSKSCFEPAFRDRHERDYSDDWNDTKYHDSHFGRGNCDTREREGCRNDTRSDRCDRGPDVNLDRKHDGIDLKVDVEQHGKNLCIDIDLGCRDLDLKFDARMLQPDSGPVTAIIGGEGNAVGEQTLVDADIFSRLMDLGSITVAFGSASFEATAVGEGLAYAAANTFADVSGADVVFIFTEKTMMPPSQDGLSWAKEVSKTTYVAIDFETFDLCGGPLVLNYDDIDLFSSGNWRGCRGNDIPRIEGNVAELNVDALAQAENTLVDVSSSVLTVENELSSVSAMAVTGIA